MTDLAIAGAVLMSALGYHLVFFLGGGEMEMCFSYDDLLWWRVCGVSVAIAGISAKKSEVKVRGWGCAVDTVIGR